MSEVRAVVPIETVPIRPAPPAPAAASAERGAEPPAAAARPAGPPADRQGLVAEVRRQLEQKLAGHDVLLRNDEDSGNVVVEVRDRESGDLVYQIPPEDLVRIGARLKDLLKDTGLLVDSTS